jgi:hypothetical protein
MQRQRGRFTVHPLNTEPSDSLWEKCVVRIELEPKACEGARVFLGQASLDAPALFPDPAGIAQLVKSEAGLVRIPPEESVAKTIRDRLLFQAQHDYKILKARELNEDVSGKLFNKGVGLCDLGPAYVPRPAEAQQMANWLENGPPILFVLGQAGMGKTNFLLDCLLGGRTFRGRPPVFFSFMLYGPPASAAKASSAGEHDLISRLRRLMVANDAGEDEMRAAEQMIKEGRAVIALDGLDELARLRGQEEVEAVAHELAWLIGGSARPRVIITCRHHIFKRLKGVGVLGRTTTWTKIELGPLPESAMLDALLREARAAKEPQPDPGKLLAMAKTPLFFLMIRLARRHWPELLKASSTPTRLEEAWFKVMLSEKGKDHAKVLTQLGQVALKMLDQRSDLVEAKSLDSELAELVRDPSKNHPFVLFVEELPDTFSFSHQALREFILAWCVSQEVNDRSFKLLRSSSSFDYEGVEFYARVNDLVPDKQRVIKTLEDLIQGKMIEEPKDEAGEIAHRRWEEQWNHLVRNLFEMIGEVMPDDDPNLAESTARIALRYLDRRQAPPCYVRYKTRYNIARALERIHVSAPRPYFDYILTNPWDTMDPSPNCIGAWAIRGFHMETQKPSPLPPMVFKERPKESEIEMLDAKVSEGLLAAMEDLRDPELPQDAIFWAINCSLALIRWLPQEPGLQQIERLLQHRHASVPMKQNLFWALFRRCGLDIPSTFREKGLFKEIGELHYACDEANEALRRVNT